MRWRFEKTEPILGKGTRPDDSDVCAKRCSVVIERASVPVGKYHTGPKKLAVPGAVRGGVISLRALISVRWERQRIICKGCHSRLGIP